MDETGVSGTGHVADGCLFDDGTVVVRWRTKTPGTTFFESLDHAKAVHAHDGKTQFCFIDHEGPQATLCSMCFASLDPMQFWCDQCGANSCDVTTHASLVSAIQEHDQQRLDSLRKCHAELHALRRVAFDLFGPDALRVDLTKTEHEGAIFHSVAHGNVSYSITKRENESDDEVLARGAESVQFDPQRIRELNAKHARKP